MIENGKVTQVGANLYCTTRRQSHRRARQARHARLDGVVDTARHQRDRSRRGNERRRRPNQAQDSAAFDVADAINPRSTLIPVARIRGVTRSLTAPVDCGDVFCGTAAVIHLGHGPDLVDKRQAGVLVELEPSGGTGQKNARPDIWAKFRETLDDAREYCGATRRLSSPRRRARPAQQPHRSRRAGPVIQGSEPLIVHVERASTIRQIAAIRADQQDQAGASWAAVRRGRWRKNSPPRHMCRSCMDNNINLPASFSDLGATLKNAARLDAAGVVVVFQPQNDNPAHYARTITQIAGNAVANGMKWDHALAAITKNPAEIWGIGDNYGTLEPARTPMS